MLVAVDSGLFNAHVQHRGLLDPVAVEISVWSHRRRETLIITAILTWRASKTGAASATALRVMRRKNKRMMGNCRYELQNIAIAA